MNNDYCTACGFYRAPLGSKKCQACAEAGRTISRRTIRRFNIGHEGRLCQCEQGDLIYAADGLTLLNEEMAAKGKVEEKAKRLAALCDALLWEGTRIADFSAQSRAIETARAAVDAHNDLRRDVSNEAT